MTLNVWFSLAAPEVIPLKATVCEPEFMLRLRLLSGFKVGGWFVMLAGGVFVVGTEFVEVTLTFVPLVL